MLVIGKDGDSKGWWRGKIGDTVKIKGTITESVSIIKIFSFLSLWQVGYFPKEYVQEHAVTSDEL